MSITDTGASMFLMSHHLTSPSSLLVIISVPVLEAVHMLQYTGSLWLWARGAVCVSLVLGLHFLYPLLHYPDKIVFNFTSHPTR